MSFIAFFFNEGYIKLKTHDTRSDSKGQMHIRRRETILRRQTVSRGSKVKDKERNETE
jgi:hypothetical protein